MGENGQQDLLLHWNGPSTTLEQGYWELLQIVFYMHGADHSRNTRYVVPSLKANYELYSSRIISQCTRWVVASSGHGAWNYPFFPTYALFIFCLHICFNTISLLFQHMFLYYCIRVHAHTCDSVGFLSGRESMHVDFILCLYLYCRWISIYQE